MSYAIALVSCRLKFGNLTLFSRLTGNGEPAPSHMEIDRYTPGDNIINSYFNYLSLLNMNTLIDTQISGQDNMPRKTEIEYKLKFDVIYQFF